MKLIHFFTDNFPSLKLITWLLPISIIWSLLSLFIAGFCKQKYKWQTGYSRKLFHFIIFISAFFYQQYFALPGVFILGWSVTLVLIYACLQGSGNLFYEALAREKDAPYRTKYIVYSYLATFFGGVLSNIFFGKFALFGYAVTGIADAIAEPVGIKFGKHHYRVFSFDKAKISHRSIEGSISVFISALLCIYLTALLTTAFQFNYIHLIFAALLCTLIEAVSPAGSDNFLLQISSSWICSVYLLNH